MSWLKSVGVECMQHDGVLSYNPNRYLTTPSTSSAGSLLLKTLTFLLQCTHFPEKDTESELWDFGCKGLYSRDDMHSKIEVVAAALIDLSKILPKCCGRPCGKLQVTAHWEQLHLLRLWDILVRKKKKERKKVTTDLRNPAELQPERGQICQVAPNVINVRQKRLFLSSACCSHYSFHRHCFCCLCIDLTPRDR